ncbi:hypothetical protein ACOMHN_025426 [Nucella lapillus]
MENGDNSSSPCKKGRDGNENQTHSHDSPACRPIKRSFLRRHKPPKMAGNGCPTLLHELPPDVVDGGPPTPTLLDSKTLSPQTDRTYNEMLHKRSTNKHSSFNRIHSKNSLQSRVYNFLERPTGWKCFIYHFTV